MVVTRQKNPGWLARLVKRYEEQEALALGWPAASTAAGLRYPDGTSVLMVAAVNQFGANISHPGGTGYTVTPQGARFVSKSFTGPVAGVTGAHSINIPARDFMNPGAVKAMRDTEGIRRVMVPAMNRGKVTKAQILEKMGPFAVSALQSAIATFTTPANAPSTVRQKGSDRPLNDTGLMRQSVTYTVRNASK